MSIEKPSSEQFTDGGEIEISKEQGSEGEVKDMERIRRNIALLIESGKLTAEQAEKLARLQTSDRIESIQEQINQFSEENLIKKENGIVDFGVDANGNSIKMKVFEPQPETWEPKFYPTKNGRYFNVGFISNTGQEYINPLNSQVVDDNDPENPDVQAAVEIERRKLNAHLEQEKTKRHSSPEKREEFKETEFLVGTMRDIAHELNDQETVKRGLLIIEGEAGTGKNWMIDHIAHLTGRPVFRFTCSRSHETPDLKYILEFTGGETRRIHSTIIEALQTEGAILEFDEINTLRPDVVSDLNSLFDAERCIKFGEDNLEVKAAHGVLLVGLMNPKTYAGTQELAPPLKDRATIMEVGYPPFVDKDESGDEFKRPDEAEMLYQYFPEFQGLSQKDFEMLWHQIVNGRESKNAQNLMNQSRHLRLIQLKKLVAIASNIREAYRQFQEEGKDPMVNFNFTLRGSSNCAMRLAQGLPPQTDQEAENQVRQSILKIFLPKLTIKEEKDNIQALINEV